MTTSESIDQLALALAKAQGEIEGASKTAANPFFKSKYADLASVREACVPALSKYELAVLQSPTAEGPRVSVETLLVHSSGQWIKDTLTVTAKDDSPQAVGSAITYARRYALQAFAGVAPEDDDGNAAQGRANGQVAKPVAVPSIPKGFEDWVLDLQAATDEGIVRFRQAWKDSKQEYRDYLTKANPQHFNALSAKAEATTAKKSAKVSA